MKSRKHPGGQNFWEQQYNEGLDDMGGAAQLLPHQVLGVLALPTIPTSGQTVIMTINGTAVTFTGVATLGANAGNVVTGSGAAVFAGNLTALAQNPQFTTTTGVSLTVANQKLLSYLGFTLVGTNLYIYSLNSTIWAPLTSFSCSTTVTGASYTAKALYLFVEPGNYWIQGSRYVFAGGITGLVTAPSSQPRIDVLSINSSGTLNWTTGTENSSPAVPAYPKNQLILCELYNVVGETALYDNDYQQAGQGYINNDVRPFLNNPNAIDQSCVEIYAADTGSANAYAVALNPALASYVTGQIVTFKATNANTTASTLAVNGGTATAIKKSGSLALVANDIVAGGLVMVQYDGTYWQLQSASANANSVPFAGLFGNNLTTHDVSVTGTQNIAHGLGTTPKFVRITAMLQGTNSFSLSIGVYNATTASNVAVQGTANGSNTGHEGVTASASNVITLYNDNAGGNPNATATISVTSTNIVLTWSNSNSPTGTANIIWEAMA